MIGTRLVENLLLPPAGLIWLTVVGLVLLARRRHRWGAGLITAGVAGTFLLSTPWVAALLLSTLDRYEPLPVAGHVPDAAAVVVLGAGSYREGREYGGAVVSGLGLERLRYGAWLARRTGRDVLVTGWSGETMAETLATSFGLEARWTVGGANTHENAVVSAEILMPAGIRRIYLVTHFWHMPRSVAVFRAAGFDPVPAPLGFAAAAPPGGASMLMPRAGPLVQSRYAAHEWVGRLWYRLRYGV